MPVFGNLLLPMLSLVRFACVTDRDSGTLIVTSLVIVYP